MKTIKYIIIIVIIVIIIEGYITLLILINKDAFFYFSKCFEYSIDHFTESKIEPNWTRIKPKQIKHKMANIGLVDYYCIFNETNINLNWYATINRKKMKFFLFTSDNDTGHWCWILNGFRLGNDKRLSLDYYLNLNFFFSNKKKST